MHPDLQDPLGALLVNLLQAIHKEQVLSEAKAIEIVGAEDYPAVRKSMDAMKLLMPHSDGSLEFTFKGLQAAMQTYVAEVHSEGKDLTEDNLMDVAMRGVKRNPRW